VDISNKTVKEINQGIDSIEKLLQQYQGSHVAEINNLTNDIRIRAVQKYT
jgi:hypothetical protein